MCSTFKLSRLNTPRNNSILLTPLVGIYWICCRCLYVYKQMADVRFWLGRYLPEASGGASRDVVARQLGSGLLIQVYYMLQHVKINSQYKIFVLTLMHPSWMWCYCVNILYVNWYLVCTSLYNCIGLCTKRRKDQRAVQHGCSSSS